MEHGSLDIASDRRKNCRLTKITKIIKEKNGIGKIKVSDNSCKIKIIKEKIEIGKKNKNVG